MGDGLICDTRDSWRRSGVLGVLVALALVAWGGPAGPTGASAQAEPDRYSLVHGCYALHSEANSSYVERDGEGYSASAADASGAEPFRMQATDLGRYLFYGPGRDFMALDGLPVAAGVVSAAEPSDDADWTVDSDGDAFTITNGFAGEQLAVAANGSLESVPEGTAGGAGRFGFEPTGGCADYPEVDLNVSGEPTTGSPAYGEVSGLLEGHMHHMAFEFLGGKAHCGRPWHRFGAPYALKDCADHEPNGCAAVLENVLYGEPARCHDPVGWPTFADWPDPRSLTHEQSYYRWLERSWRGGLRVFVNLLVENRVLCEAYPLKQNDCDEMESVKLQAQRMHELEDYIDAQSGGPGEGWFRIVRNPFQARQVINEGKLAVIMGMEVSEPFGCSVKQPNGIQNPDCTEDDIDGWLDELHAMGVRQLEIVNKFDNALTGVAGDNGTTGTAVNGANFLSTLSFWALDDNCEDPAENHDHSPTGISAPHNDDQILANVVDEFLSPGVAPVYPEGPLCNQLGLSDLGKYALERIMEERMVFDPDHMSVKARDQAMTELEQAEYPGLISSHSWSTPNTLPRIYKLGGVITPYAGSSENFVHQWQHLSSYYSGRQYFGVGYGADMNGFGSQGLPRGAGVSNPVTYPFQSFDGEVTIDKQTSGERVYDINVDGVAHYGLYPDWIEDLRKIAGDEIIEDMGRGAEAYLQMWERTEGIDKVRCGGWRGHQFTPGGLGSRVKLDESPRATLERAGQPSSRTRTWRWCASASKPGKRVRAVFTRRDELGLVVSTVGRNSAAGIGTDDPASRLSGRAQPLGGGLWVRDAGDGRKFVFGAGAGQVDFVGVASADVADSEASLRRYVARSGVV